MGNFTGMSISINDVIEIEELPKPNPASDMENSRTSLSIGCAPHDNTTCSRMTIHHLYYWDDVVKGKPFMELGQYALWAKIALWVTV